VDEDTAMGQLVLDVQQRAGSTLVRIAGDLDAATAPDLADLCRSVHAHGDRDVVIDLTDTSFLDSSGLRALVGARRLFGDGGGSLRLAHPSEPVIRLLEITGLRDYFAIDEPTSG
jgi:anti-sigma B factor antagonist